MIVFLEFEEANPALLPIATAMKEKFLKYWEDVPLLTIAANCLHPTYKKRWTVKILHMYYRNLDITRTNVDQVVTIAIEGLYNAYNARRSNTASASGSKRGVSV